MASSGNRLDPVTRRNTVFPIIIAMQLRRPRWIPGAGSRNAPGAQEPLADVKELALVLTKISCILFNLNRTFKHPLRHVAQHAHPDNRPLHPSEWTPGDSERTGSDLSSA
jgi:hypothetical protein